MFIKSYSDIQQNLAEACKWAGIIQGRANDYQKHLEQLHVENSKSREALLCIADLMDILDIYETWKVNDNNFPGIRDRIREVIEKGPILPEEENIEIADNRARNDLFVYLFAGKLIQAGVQVLSIDGITGDNYRTISHGDIVSTFQNEEIAIECKRPQKPTTIDSCARKAWTQIQKSGRKGCMALDCSKAIHPPGTLLDFSNDDEARNTLLDQIEIDIVPKIKSHLNQNVFGAFLMVSVPGMKNFKESAILSSNGTPFKQYTPFRVSTMLVASNERIGEKHPFMKWVFNRLKSSQGPFGFLEQRRETNP
ncbi:MAG: hypothetical protein KC584_06535 [Nitrospira sp.]|nr:hypothetical protein [Nitrospira sp.]